MVATTPVYGLPYPTSSDGYDDALMAIPQDLAETVESTLAGFGGVAAPGSWVSVGGGGGAPAFATNWGNYGSGFQTVQYRKTGNIITIRGLVLRSSTTSGASSTIFTLPSGFRPPATLLIASGYAAGSDAFARIDISTAGVVSIFQAVTAGNYVSLNIPPFHID